MVIKINDNKYEDIDANIEIKDYIEWNYLKPFKTDDDIIYILNYLLFNINCARIYSYGRPMMTTYPAYKYYINTYMYYATHIVNQITYNKMVDILIEYHKFNVDFELNNPIKKKDITKRKKARKGKFIKHITKDMFTNEITYVYTNTATGETIESDKDDLLDELNGVKKKIKVRKQKQSHSAVPISAMTFSFRKK